MKGRCISVLTLKVGNTSNIIVVTIGNHPSNYPAFSTAQWLSLRALFLYMWGSNPFV
jgi:hypothetical protein